MRKGAHGAAGCDVSFCLKLRVERRCSGGDSCGRTLVPGSCSSGDGHLVAPGQAGRAEGSSPHAGSWPRCGAGMAPCDPIPPSTPQHVPTQPHTSASQPPAPWAVPVAEAGSRWTDRQTSTCRSLRLYCRTVFTWQLQLSSCRVSVSQILPFPVQGLPGGAEASQGQKHPNSSSSWCGVAVMGGTALAGWGVRGQEGVPVALGWVSSPVPWCCCLSQRAAGFPGRGFCTVSSTRRPCTPGPAPQAPSH